MGRRCVFLTMTAALGVVAMTSSFVVAFHCQNYGKSIPTMRQEPTKYGLLKTTTARPSARSFSDLTIQRPQSRLVFSSAAPSADDGNSDKTTNSAVEKPKLRSRLRQWTGFSFTALRATLRAATGISLSAIYVSTVAATGAWIRNIMKLCLSIFPAWLRYFVQPFLVLYYAPLFIIRNVTGPTRKNAKQTHEHFIEGWKQAVQEADETTAYWPIHLAENGGGGSTETRSKGAIFETDFQEVDVNEAVAESVELSMEKASNTGAE